MDHDDEQVEVACRAFHKAVHGWCRRYTRLPLLEENNNKPSLPRDVTHLLNHVSHFARQLTRKRNSLRSGLTYLQETLLPEILEGFFSKTSSGSSSSSSSSSSEQVALLQHFLVQCLRLHDGKMLLVSGECRHPGDIRLAKKKHTQYPSQLALQTHRPDGYTKLYNAPGGYSGYGWDEFHDPEVGIRTRLLEALERYSKQKKRKSQSQIADYLTDHGGQLLESLLDQHESEMNVIKAGFNALKDRVPRDLKQKFMTTAPSKTVKVVFTLYDKMEKLQVGNIVLERHGDAFQVNDTQGALPNGYKAQDWSRVMALPQSTATAKTANSSTRCNNPDSQSSTNNNKSVKPANGANGGKKRRRVILEDSSDDEEEDKDTSGPPTKKKELIAKTKKHQSAATSSNKSTETPSLPETPVAKASSSGLQVKVKKVSKSPTPGEGTSLSLATIKTQMGANVQALEAAREEVEKEEAVASKAAKADEVEAKVTSIAKGESSIRSQRRVLGRILVCKDKRDVKEIWDARELLREQLMAVGNQILWEPFESDPSSETDRKEILLVALQYFQEAKRLVKDQEVFRRQLNSQGKYSPAESRFFSRNLLLLEGQAHTNLGITNIELATQTKRKTKYTTKESKRFLSQAIEELSMAKQFAESLRSRATLDKERGSNAVETWIDFLRADQLESLALRWWGTALWHQGLRKEATELFESGASFFAGSLDSVNTENAMDDKGVLEAFRQLGADCFYACTALVDLASSDMEDLPPTGAVQEGNAILVLIKKILAKASDVSKAVCAFFETHPDDDVSCDEYMEENQIMEQKAVHLYLAEIEEWWKRRMAIANKPIAVDALLPERRNVPLQRSEVEPLGLEKLPTRVFTVTEGGGSRRKGKRKGPNPSYHKHSGNLLSALPRHAEPSNEDRSTEAQPKRYRPWGDELLPQIIDEATGRSIPKIVYPAVAPLMPPEIRALLEAA